MTMRNLSKPRFAFRWMTSIAEERRGAAALMAIIIFVAIIALAAGSVALLSLANLESGFASQTSTDAVLSAESCIDEALYQLREDSSYTGGTLLVGDAQCTISVTGGPCGTCTIRAEATADTYTRVVEADATFTGSTFDLTRFEEVE